MWQSIKKGLKDLIKAFSEPVYEKWERCTHPSEDPNWAVWRMRVEHGWIYRVGESERIFWIRGDETRYSSSFDLPMEIPRKPVPEPDVGIPPMPQLDETS